jgi:CubicO group peptidase (beta-lactamase class C family)
LELFAPLREQRPFRRLRALKRAANARRSGSRDEALYSDLGYLLVGASLEHSLKEPLDELLTRELSEPLGSRAASARIWARRQRDFERRTAPTEVVHWRGGTLRGVVHDENSWALSGHGVPGHAGLFATVHDVVRLGTAMLDALSGRERTILSESTARYLVEERAGGTLRCGFDGKSDDSSTAGPSASLRSFGHLGFTGTSFWCDPETDVVTVLLTNRVHPTRDNWEIRKARPIVHDQLFSLGARPAALTRDHHT